MEPETIEVDRDYLWALEVLACDSLGIDGETSERNSDRFGDAMGVAEDASLSQPIKRHDSEGREITYSADTHIETTPTDTQ
jgi:hypothetical protein